ncbi:MAG: hypothetical protein NT050_02970, partial [Verrucomicrobia bacterium]|nr:hypothetical protein [Verrucomicrobiota bacterium]
ASRSWEINGIEWTAHIKDAFLRRSGERYWVEVLGKNGEPVPDHALPMTFHRRGFNNTVEISLRTDAQGHIDLGALADITQLEATPAPDLRRSWPLETSAQTRPRELHARVGETVRLPWSPQGRPDAWSLLELRGGTFATDRTTAVRASGNVLEIAELAAGDYSLRLRDPDESVITLRIGDGVPVAGWLVGSRSFSHLRSSPRRAAPKSRCKTGTRSPVST